MYYKVSIDCMYHLNSVLAVSDSDATEVLLSKQNFKKLYIPHILIILDLFISNSFCQTSGSYDCEIIMSLR